VQIHADSGAPLGAINYIAVLADTSSGRKVVLLQFLDITNRPEWWSEVYDVK
jgi:hypothetical protein